MIVSQIHNFCLFLLHPFLLKKRMSHGCLFVAQLEFAYNLQVQTTGTFLRCHNNLVKLSTLG